MSCSEKANTNQWFGILFILRKAETNIALNQSETTHSHIDIKSHQEQDQNQTLQHLFTFLDHLQLLYVDLS